MIIYSFLFQLFNSNKSYGSHKNRSFKDESHKGSLDSLDGEEKKDASKEDLEEQGIDQISILFIYFLIKHLIFQSIVFNIEK